MSRNTPSNAAVLHGVLFGVRSNGHGGGAVVAKKVLIADDNRQIRMLVSAALRSCDCEIIESEDGEQAVDIAVAEKPDLVLLDVMMPKLDGFEVLHFIRRRPELEGTKVVMLTTATATADRERGEEEGADDYMVKPFEASELRDLVQKHLA
jgi:DNA-binding response OmpR family regulator